MNISGKITHQELEAVYRHLANTRPDLFKEVHSELKELLPSFILADFDLIPSILKWFCAFRGIKPAEIIGTNILFRNIEYRREFLTVLLLCYHPEKLYGITDKRVWPGIEKLAAKTLGCSRESLGNFIPIIINHFEYYQSFRSITTQAHAVIIKKCQDQAPKEIKIRKYTTIDELSQEAAAA